MIKKMLIIILPIIFSSGCALFKQPEDPAETAEKQLRESIRLAAITETAKAHERAANSPVFEIEVPEGQSLPGGTKIKYYGEQEIPDYSRFLKRDAPKQNGWLEFGKAVVKAGVAAYGFHELGNVLETGYKAAGDVNTNSHNSGGDGDFSITGRDSISSADSADIADSYNDQSDQSDNSSTDHSGSTDTISNQDSYNDSSSDAADSYNDSSDNSTQTDNSDNSSTDASNNSDNSNHSDNSDNSVIN